METQEKARFTIDYSLVCTPEKLEGFLAKLRFLQHIEQRPLLVFKLSAEELRQFLHNTPLETVLRWYFEVKIAAPHFSHWVLNNTRNYLAASILQDPEGVSQKVVNYWAIRVPEITAPKANEEQDIVVTTLTDVSEDLYRHKLEPLLKAIEQTQRPDFIFPFIVQRKCQYQDLSSPCLLYLGKKCLASGLNFYAEPLLMVLLERNDSFQKEAATELLKQWPTIQESLPRWFAKCLHVVMDSNEKTNL